MRIAACIAKPPGVDLLRFMAAQEAKPEFVITWEHDIQAEKIEQICRRSGIECFRNLKVNSVEFARLCRSREIGIVFLIWWPVIVRKRSLDAVRVGFVNLHPSLLPHNRGMNPYYWSIVDGTPAGVTIHLASEKIDEGDILFQRELDVPITETGESLYARTAQAMIELFQENYHRLVSGEFRGRRQEMSAGSFHRVADMEEHSWIDPGRSYRAGDLINRLRARTFADGESAFFYHEGKKYYIRVSISEAEGSERDDTEHDAAQPSRARKPVEAIP